jgi:hypothetical protein
VPEGVRTPTTWWRAAVHPNRVTISVLTSPPGRSAPPELPGPASPAVRALVAGDLPGARPGRSADDQSLWPLPLAYTCAHSFCVLGTTLVGASARIITWRNRWLRYG